VSIHERDSSCSPEFKKALSHTLKKECATNGTFLFTTYLENDLTLA
jgi:hypothetical protein